jgi:hypothetical protein
MRLHHVQVVVPAGRAGDVVPFYELLGLVRVAKPTDGVAQTGAWFDFPGGTQQLHVSEKSGSPHPEQHFALSVEDLDGLVRSLATAGHPFRPGSVVLGARRGMTADPVGNPVELVEAVGPFA